MLGKVLCIIALLVLVSGCAQASRKPTADEKQKQQTETIQQEAVAQVGMPAIKNFRELKFAKDILELRDQEGLSTYTYLWSDFQGKLVFLCDSIGYGLPYATQFTNPEKESRWRDSIGGGLGVVTLPQAEPNGLFSPASAEGTWVLCKDPSGKDVRAIYIEPRILVSQFKLEATP